MPKTLPRETMTIFILATMAVILFTNKTASMSLMAFDATDIKGWWNGLSQTSHTIALIFAGLIALTLFVNIWFKEK